MVCMAVFEVDMEHARVFFYHVKALSEKFETNVSYDYDEFLQAFMIDIVCPNEREKFFRIFNLHSLNTDKEERKENISMEFRFRGGKTKENRWLNMGLMFYGGASRAIGAILDVQEEKDRELEMLHQISHDPLTGLLNRQSFEREVFSCMEDGKKEGAYCLVDVDNFKVINDTRGHNYGDRVLIHMAEILKNSAPKGAMVARYGGDEFCMFFPGISTKEQVTPILESISRNVRKMEADSPELSVSMGVAFSQKHFAGGKDELERCADVALYKVKESGKKAFAIYEEEMGDF